MLGVEISGQTLAVSRIARKRGAVFLEKERVGTPSIVDPGVDEWSAAGTLAGSWGGRRDWLGRMHTERLGCRFDRFSGTNVNCLDAIFARVDEPKPIEEVARSCHRLARGQVCHLGGIGRMISLAIATDAAPLVRSSLPQVRFQDDAQHEVLGNEGRKFLQRFARVVSDRDFKTRGLLAYALRGIELECNGQPVAHGVFTVKLHVIVTPCRLKVMVTGPAVTPLISQKRAACCCMLTAPVPVVVQVAPGNLVSITRAFLMLVGSDHRGL